MSTKTPEQRVEERIASEQYWATPEGRAVKRWPADKSMDGRTNLTLTKRNIRQGYATCIREEVEPRDRLLQELVDALAYATESMNCDDWGEVDLNGEGAMAPYAHDIVSMPGGCPLCNATAALAKAKEQFGITPTTP